MVVCVANTIVLSFGEGAIERGDEGMGLEGRSWCLKWLDTKEEGLVVFINYFRRWCHFTMEQLWEMAAWLEALRKAFLWAVRGTNEDATKMEEWMLERWEERVGEGGLVVKIGRAHV